MRALYLVLGNPVAHSRSPRLHARAFELLGLDAVYAPCEVSDLPAALTGLRALRVAGANVTVPHKEEAARLCDSIDEAAREIGAVNCIARHGDLLRGHNTDAPGLLRALGTLPRGKAVVVGAGGSARAVVWALSRAGMDVVVVNRTVARGEDVARRFRVRSGAAGELREASLVVNCTTVGMGNAELPFDAGVLPPLCTVCDLVYAGGHGFAPGDTALLAAARARGLRAVDGLEVLVHQAIASLEIWIGSASLAHLAPELRKAAAS